MKNVEELEDIIKKLVSILHGYGVKAEPKDREIVNVTAKLEPGRRINLVEAAEKLGGIYDPDYRPYVVIKINRTTIIVPQYGRIVTLGSPSIGDTKETIRKILYLIRSGS